jgi:ABC-type microcin C transport system permease subunit YejE
MNIKTSEMGVFAIWVALFQICLIKSLVSQSAPLDKVRTRGKWYVDEVTGY